VLKDLANRFGVEDSRGTLLITDLLHAKLAEMIGSSRPMITRLINEMVDQGVLARRGKQYVLLNRPEHQLRASLNQYEAKPSPVQSVSLGRNGAPKSPLHLQQSNSAVYAAANGRPSTRSLPAANPESTARIATFKS